MAQITYTNKVALNENPEIANINKVTDDDMNEIKSVVNANYNNTIQITNTEPTDSDNKIWIDTGEVQNIGSEIESGSNANGSWIKFADGTMICYDTKYFSTAGWQTVTYPVEYVSTPTVLCNTNSGTTESATFVLTKVSNIGLTTFRTCIVLTSGYDNGTVNWIAIGKWK